MTLESNYTVAFATLSNHWSKNLAPVYQPMKRKLKPIATRTGDFCRALSKLHGVATNLDWFIGLFPPAVVTLVFVLRHSIENGRSERLREPF